MCIVSPLILSIHVHVIKYMYIVLYFFHIRSQLLLTRSHNEPVSSGMLTPVHTILPTAGHGGQMRGVHAPPPEMMATEVIQTARSNISKLEHHLVSGWG